MSYTSAGEVGVRGGKSLMFSGPQCGPLGCLMHLFSLGRCLSNTTSLQPQHFYLGVVIREDSLLGKTGMILYKIEKIFLCILKNEGVKCKVMGRLKPVLHPPPNPGPLLSLLLLGRILVHCPSPTFSSFS